MSPISKIGYYIYDFLFYKKFCIKTKQLHKNIVDLMCCNSLTYSYGS